MKPITRASIALILDIITFIVLSRLAMISTNIILIIVLALLMFGFAYDAGKAIGFIIRCLINKK